MTTRTHGIERDGDTITVGQFTYNFETGQVAGPEAYMRAEGIDLLRRIEAGSDVVFLMNPYALSHPERSILVSLQTNYAGWIGLQSFNDMRERVAVVRDEQR